MALVCAFAAYLLSPSGRSLPRGRQSLTAQLSQAGQGGECSHCAQSGFTQGESASRHFHCRGSCGGAPGGRDERQPADGETKRDAGKERGRESERDGDRERERLPDGRMDRKRGEEKSCCSHPLPRTAPMRLSLRLSPNFSAPPRPSAGCMPPPLPSPHLPSLTPSPHISLVLSSSSSHPLSAHPSTWGCACRLRHFFSPSSVCEFQSKFCSAG